ncbi:unnamed protein product [Gordionus sp. m RMFG-2023]
MPIDSKTLNTLKIKSGVVKRYANDIKMYKYEIEKQSQKIKTMKSNNDDEYDIRKQEEVLQESVSMISRSKYNFINAYDDLNNIMSNVDKDTQSEEYINAEKILTDFLIIKNEIKC